MNYLALSENELDLIRQWFDAVQDLNAAYLETADYHLAKKIYSHLEMRIPNSVTIKCAEQNMWDGK